MSEISYYFHHETMKAGPFPDRLKSELNNCDTFLLFLSEDSKDGVWQTQEISDWLNFHGNDKSRLIVIEIGTKGIKPLLPSLNDVQKIPFDIKEPNGHVDCAKSILELLDESFAPFDDLPTSIDAKYEKDIINSYKDGNGKVGADLIQKGYPEYWPVVSNFCNNATTKLIINPLEEDKYGKHRDDNIAISVDARIDLQQVDAKKRQSLLTLPEAGPRKTIITPPNILNVAILVSGGIAPGINSVINAIMDRHNAYEENYRRTNEMHRVIFHGCIEGFKSLCRVGGRIKILSHEEVRSWANLGGSLLPTSREDDLLSNDPIKRHTVLTLISTELAQKGINVLYVIGGEGSMRGAHAIWTVFHRLYPSKHLSIIGIPKTMDNDILWVWQSFGFLSAIEKARHDILQLSTEVKSNPRVGVMQLFGSTSGFVVSHAALGSNVCDLVLIPEMSFNMVEVCKYMGRKLSIRRNNQNNVGNSDALSPWGLIVMSETAIPTDFKLYYKENYVGLSQPEIDALDLFDINNRKVHGQTSDELRSACLKLVSKVLEHYIQNAMGKGNAYCLQNESKLELTCEADDYWEGFRVFCNEPRHLIRSMAPNINDVAFGIRLGTMAVDMALGGYTDCMVSQWLTEYVAVPLKLVVLGRKQMPKEGIFWKTVITKTGQIGYPSLS